MTFCCLLRPFALSSILEYTERTKSQNRTKSQTARNRRGSRKRLRSSARNRSQHEIAGIETSTKSQPARNRSQHSQSETATSTKSQPARIRSQHSQHEITANTKSQPPRNRRRKLETHQCNEAQLQRCSIETIVRAVLRFNTAQFKQCPCMLCTGSH